MDRLAGSASLEDVTDEKHQADLEWLYGGNVPPSRPVVPARPPAPAPPPSPVEPASEAPIRRPRLSQDDIAWLYGDRPPVAQPAVDQPAANPPTVDMPAMPSPPAEPAPRVAPSRPAPVLDAPPTVVPPKPRIPLRKKLGRGGVAIVVLLALWVAFLIYAPLHGWNSVPKVATAVAGQRPPQQPGTAILLVGTDSRDSLTPEQQQQLGTGGGGIGSRTDTMLIYYIPPHGNPALISLPRDSYLPIPGHDKNKLNAAYSFGGAPLLIQTVEQATGIRIDGYLEVGFGGFVSLVDLVGGIEVCLDNPVVDQNSNLNLPKGCQTLNGANALGYVRQRYQDPLGDLGRVQRQREVISKLVKKLATPATVLNPVRYWKVCQALPGILTKGDGTGLGTMSRAAVGALAFSRGNAYSLTVPIANANASTPAGSSVLWNDAKAHDMFAMIAKGDTSQLGQFTK